MNWKYTAASTGVTALVGWLTLSPPHVAPVPTPTTKPAAARGTSSDIEQQALRLRQRVRDETAFRTPRRDPFHFAARPRPTARAERTVAPPAPIEPAQPLVLPIKLAGIATDIVDGETVRTGVLRTLRGVELVRAGDTLEGGFVVMTVGESYVELQKTADGSVVRLQFSGDRSQ